MHKHTPRGPQMWHEHETKWILLLNIYRLILICKNDLQEGLKSIDNFFILKTVLRFDLSVDHYQIQVEGKLGSKQ